MVGVYIAHFTRCLAGQHFSSPSGQAINANRFLVIKIAFATDIFVVISILYHRQHSNKHDDHKDHNKCSLHQHMVRIITDCLIMVCAEQEALPTKAQHRRVFVQLRPTFLKFKNLLKRILSNIQNITKIVSIYIFQALTVALFKDWMYYLPFMS